MSRFVRIFKTSVGCKVVMALTGFALVLFVIQHCIANLQIYKGQDAMNDYAAFLKGLGPALWVARGGLLGIFLLHIFAGMRLNRMNMAARNERYQYNAFVQEDPLAQARVRAATFMFLSGLLVLLFVIYHLAHFTFGWINPEAFHLEDAEGRHDVYSMFILGFKNPLISAIYWLLMLALGAHMIHGFSSAFQSLGWNHPTFNKIVRYGCPTVVVIIVLLNMMMPFTILALGYPALPEDVASAADDSESASADDQEQSSQDNTATNEAGSQGEEGSPDDDAADNNSADNDSNNAGSGDDNSGDGSNADGSSDDGQTEPPTTDPPTSGDGGQLRP